MHAKPRSEHKSGIGARTADFAGNVPIEGTGSWEDHEAAPPHGPRWEWGPPALNQRSA
jgi:hypothetical protein